MTSAAQNTAALQAGLQLTPLEPPGNDFLYTERKMPKENPPKTQGPKTGPGFQEICCWWSSGEELSPTTHTLSRRLQAQAFWLLTHPSVYPQQLGPAKPQAPPASLSPPQLQNLLPSPACVLLPHTLPLRLEMALTA